MGYPSTVSGYVGLDRERVERAGVLDDPCEPTPDLRHGVTVGHYDDVLERVVLDEPAGPFGRGYGTVSSREITLAATVYNVEQPLNDESRRSLRIQ